MNDPIARIPLTGYLLHRLTAALRIYERLGFVRLPFPEPSPYADADVYMEVAV